MPQIKIVLCPVDFTDLSRREVRVAVEVCEAFGARLVLHHHLNVAPPGLIRVWEWSELDRDGTISEPEAERRLRALLAELPKSLRAEASLSHGSIGTVLVEMARALPADLVVLGSHGRSSLDHASLTERTIAVCPCPVLTIDEGACVERFRLRPATGVPRTTVVVPTDLSAAAARMLDYAADLARVASLDLHLLHVMPAWSERAAIEPVQHRLESLAKERSMEHTICQVEFGDAAQAILRLTDQIDAGFILMGEDARGLLLRLLTRDVARAVLHRASCPVWFVPAGRL
jgi:universal stress protein A